MGCVQGKATGYSFNRTVEEMKQQNGYRDRGRGRGQQEEAVKPELGTIKKSTGAGNGEENKISNRERERLVLDETTDAPGNNNNNNNNDGNVEKKKINGEDVVDGWPKWLVDNIHRDILAGMVPRSADSYHKLAKVSIFCTLLSI